MRNVGRVPATSHYIFPSDLELYPSPGLIPQFLKLVTEGDYIIIITISYQYVIFIFKIGKDPAFNRTSPRVFVLAIFEIEEGYDVPEDKATLVKLLKKGIVIPFHKHWCLSCHQIPKVPSTKLV